LKNTITKIKNSMDGLNVRTERTEKRSCKLELKDKIVETTTLPKQ
jgi:hypothetical protein